MRFARLCTIFTLTLWLTLSSQTTERPHTTDNGGGGASNGTNKQIASIGQAVIGFSGSTNYQNQAGYITASIGPFLGIKEEPQQENSKLPTKFELSQNSPNPFNSRTLIHIALPEDCEFTFNVYNSLGELIHSETHTTTKGKYILEFNAGSLPSGVYLYELKAGSNIARKRMLIVK